MFLLNGNRKPKKVYENEINFSENFSAFKDLLLNSRIGKKPPIKHWIKRYFTCCELGLDEKNNDSFSIIREILPIEQAKKILVLKKVREGEIFFFYNYEKRNKKLRVSFYVIPKASIDQVYHLSNSLYNNDLISLKSDFIFSNEIVNGNFKNKKFDSSSFKRVSIDYKREENVGAIKCRIKVTKKLIGEKKIFIDYIYFKKHGLYDVLLDGVAYVLLVDTENIGNESLPFYFLENKYLI